MVYSTGYVDQNGCAARVAHHGLGVVADQTVDDSLVIEANIETALTDPDIQSRVASMQGVFAAYRSPDRAVEAIEAAGQSTGR